jgi:replication factor C subunit 1
VVAKKPTPKKTTPNEKKVESTTTSTYFSSNGKNKILRSAPVKSIPKPKPEPIEQEEENYLYDDDDLDDGIFAEQFKKAEDDYKEEPRHKNENTDSFVAKEDKKEMKRVKGVTSKRKSPQLEDDDEDLEQVKPATKARRPAAKRAKATPKKEEPVESENVKKILDSVPTIRAPTPPPRDGEGKKFNFRDFKQRQGPAAQGSKELPEGEENCLTGLTFVFTGVLESLSREDGQQLVKKYGG